MFEPPALLRADMFTLSLSAFKFIGLKVPHLLFHLRGSTDALAEVQLLFTTHPRTVGWYSLAYNGGQTSKFLSHVIFFH